MHTFVIVAVTNTVWNPRQSGLDARFFNGPRNLRMSGPNPWSNMVSASSKTCIKVHHHYLQKHKTDVNLNGVEVALTDSMSDNRGKAVDYQVSDVTVNHIALFYMLQNPSRSTHNHINWAVQGIFLGSWTPTTTNHGWSESSMVTDRLGNTEHLEMNPDFLLIEWFHHNLTH